MNITIVWQLVAIASALLGIANLIWMWLAQMRQPGEKAIQELQKLCQGLDSEGEAVARRVDRIESEMRHVPTKDDLHEVKNSITAMIGQMKVVETEVAAATRTMRRIEDHMREEKA
ncbi:DUF2730 family protein [Sphingomonas paucimobilis]|uniref:DUF2730 family protein n=1 Tax=Sphingomonas paucimobilis TaxID=13689 RepID=A0A7T3E7Y7_SPHPI|nr:DUF2730 family protein [Sphingomonas paucimobilis]QPT09861.1 DUF2730 family protein [Sphingomonas paucimobilis]